MMLDQAYQYPSNKTHILTLILQQRSFCQKKLHNALQMCLLMLTLSYNTKHLSSNKIGIRHDCCDEHVRQLGLTVTLPHGVHHSLSNHSVTSQILKLFVFLLLDKKKFTLGLGIGFGLGMK